MIEAPTTDRIRTAYDRAHEARSAALGTFWRRLSRRA